MGKDPVLVDCNITLCQFSPHLFALEF